MTDKISQIGNVVFPLPSIGSNPTPIIQLADPVEYQICSFFSQLLNTNLLPRFSDEAAACGLTHANLQNWIDGYAVAQTVAFPLYPAILKSTDFKFPLMAVHPVGSDPIQVTLTDSAIQRTLVISWVFPPLSPVQMNKMYHFLGDAEKVWMLYGQQGYDPKVNSNSIWQTAGLSFGALLEIDYEPYLGLNQKDEDNYFPSIQFTIQVVEKNIRPVPQNFTTFNNLNLQLNVVDGYNIASPIVNFIDGYITPDISITSCTPNTGSVNGGTLVYVHGNGFSADKIKRADQLTFNGSPAKQITVLTPTLMLALTNPNVAGTGNVVFTDLQGNTYQLTNGFTFA